MSGHCAKLRDMPEPGPSPNAAPVPPSLHEFCVVCVVCVCVHWWAPCTSLRVSTAMLLTVKIYIYIYMYTLCIFIDMYKYIIYIHE